MIIKHQLTHPVFDCTRWNLGVVTQKLPKKRILKILNQTLQAVFILSAEILSRILKKIIPLETRLSCRFYVLIHLLMQAETWHQK